MKKVLVEKYQCDWCGQQFDTEEEANAHEKNMHKCPNCKHVWFLYGTDQECSLHECNFEQKENI